MAYYPNGLGQDLGNALAVSGPPLFCTGKVWFVDSATGSDSYDGRSESRPLATMAQAQTNASDGDIVVLMDGHAETFTSTLSLSKSIRWVAAGKSDGKPTVKLTNNQASSAMLSATANGVELRNIWIEEESQANSNATISATGSGFRMSECYMELDGNTDGYGVELGQIASELALLRNCTFISTASSISDVPNAAVYSNGTGIIWMQGVTFDGGEYGFDLGYAYDEDGGTATSVLICDETSLLRGADMRIISTSNATIQVSSDSKSPRIDDTGAAGG
jgi:hypothetical protein